MKIVIAGAAGQLGTDLQTVFGDQAIGMTRAELDISDRDSVSRAFEKTSPDCVINAAAYNKVDQAEDEPEVAFAANALGPRNLALGCAERDIMLVHVSTDYVFGLNTDQKTPYTEHDTPGPVSAYAVSKLAGEQFVRSLTAKHFVLRTCGLYGHAARDGAGKGNFVETMLRLGAERDELTVVSDQHCTPTSSIELARIIRDLIPTDAYGLYHAVNSGESTWYDFACEIFEQSGTHVKVKAIPSSGYPTKAKRPGYSLLDNSRLQKVIGRSIPGWKDALAEYLEERKNSVSG